MSKLAESTIEDVFNDLKEPLLKEAFVALKNAQTLGYGFVLLKRHGKGIRGFKVMNVLWPEIEDALRDLGAKNSYHTYEKRKPKV